MQETKNSIRVRVDQDVYHIKSKIFSGGEIHVDISGLPSKCNDYCVKARMQSSEDIMHAIMLINALEHYYPDAESTMVIPYMPYARQDRVCSAGQHFGLGTIAHMLGEFILNKIVLVDPHSYVTEDWVEYKQHANCQVSVLSQADIISDYNPLADEIGRDNLMVVAPDKGATEKAQRVADVCFSTLRVAQGSKVRDPESGKLTGFDVDVQDFQGKDLLIVDDICDGGGTFIGLAEVLKERNCGSLSLYVTHGIFSNGFKELAKVFDKVYTTDSFRRPDSYSNESINMIGGVDLTVIKL